MYGKLIPTTSRLYPHLCNNTLKKLTKAEDIQLINTLRREFEKTEEVSFYISNNPFLSTRKKLNATRSCWTKRSKAGWILSGCSENHFNPKQRKQGRKKNRMLIAVMLKIQLIRLSKLLQMYSFGLSCLWIFKVHFV